MSNSEYQYKIVMQYLVEGKKFINFQPFEKVFYYENFL